MELAKRLKLLRIAKNLTTREVSKHLGLGDSTISNYENEFRKPDVEMLARLADFYGVTTDFLLGRTTHPNTVIKTDLPEEILAAGIKELAVKEEYKDKKLDESEIKAIVEFWFKSKELMSKTKP